MARTWVANLDVESCWQRLLLPQKPMPALGPRALERLSAFGTLLRAFCGPGDELWTPAAVDPARLTSLLPVPRLISGARPHCGAESPDAEPSWGDPGVVAARLNHRRFGWELSRRLGVALDGADFVTTAEQLFARLAQLDDWVVKAPLSAAGRWRVIGRGAPDDAATRRLRNLLARSDGLLVEPWLERLDDFGVLLDIGAGTVRLASSHRQLVDSAGAFVGIDWHQAGLDEVLAPELAAVLAQTARQTGQALSAAGYRGPAGIDAWTWQPTSGGVKLNPLGEINVRLSFGWIARRIASRLGRERLCLRLGSARQLARLGGRAEVLLSPDARGTAAAWIE